MVIFNGLNYDNAINANAQNGDISFNLFALNFV
jgi:hypothetical protein